MASPTNIRLGWKGLPGTNALAYYEKSQLTAVKSFITLAPGALIIFYAELIATYIVVLTKWRVD
jgi:hypothetical protein